MAHQHFAHSRPRVIQGNFQGRQPAFVAQAQPAFAQASQRQAPHVQAALQQPAPHLQIAPRHTGPPSPAAQPKRFGNAFQVPPTVNLARPGQGRPLPDVVRQKMESFFNTDFSDVRVHVGAQAKSIGAVAFTMGSQIHFAPGHYNPTTSHGQRLLGHELTHVMQQRTGRVRNPFGGGVAVVQDPGMEAEAERMGTQAAMHQTAVQTASGTMQLKPTSPFSSSTSGATAHLRCVVIKEQPLLQLTPASQLDRNGGVVQRKKVQANVTGLTHLVRMENGSIFLGTQVDKVKSGDKVTIETSVKYRSRRGPNQEKKRHRAFESTADHIYRWFKVVTVKGLPAKPNTFIRDDTFTVPNLRDLGKKLAKISPLHRRRGGVYVVFEAWYNANVEMDPGHLVMRDYEGHHYYEYEIAKKSDITSKYAQGIGTKVPYKDSRTGDLKMAISKRLKFSQLPVKTGIEKQKKKKRSQKIRFTHVYWTVATVTSKEYKHITERIKLRKTFGSYNFVKEAQAQEQYATRCLSLLEDLAANRGQDLKTGNARDVLADFVLKNKETSTPLQRVEVSSFEGQLL